MIISGEAEKQFSGHKEVRMKPVDVAVADRAMHFGERL